MRIMLWALQSPINIGMILRTAEIYACEVGIFDSFGVLQSRGETISDFACGALQRWPPVKFEDADSAWSFAGMRSVATAIAGDAVDVGAFGFCPNDCIVVGNEYDGLPDAIMRRATARVTIPMPSCYLPKPRSTHPIDPGRSLGTNDNGRPNLNVAVASSIIMFVANSQSQAIASRQ